jgi:hypothetical protein
MLSRKAWTSVGERLMKVAGRKDQVDEILDGSSMTGYLRA